MTVKVKRIIARIALSILGGTVLIVLVHLHPNYVWPLCSFFFLLFVIGNAYHERTYVRGYREGTEAAYAAMEKLSEERLKSWESKKEQILKEEETRAIQVSTVLESSRVNGHMPFSS
jgi:hypothetical protein